MSQATQDRRWEIDLQVDEAGNLLEDEFEASLQHQFAKAGAVLHTIGGALQAYVIREQDEQSGLWFPVKAVFKWQSFVPGIRAPRPPSEPEPEPDLDVEPEPAEAGEVQTPGEEPSGA